MSGFNMNNNGFNGGNNNFDPNQVINLEAGKAAMKKASKTMGVVIAIFAVLVVLGQCLYVVDETQHAIKTRFNEIIEVNTNGLTEEEWAQTNQNPIYETVKLTQGAGLKFKIPFVDKVGFYDNRLITYDTAPREVITLDKKKLILDNNAQWSITDPYKFRLTMNSIASANKRIEDLMYSKVNEKVGKTDAHDLIANKEYIENMLHEISEELNVATAEYGVTVADVRIKRTDLPKENNENIYNRMRTERQQTATQYRSEGREEATKIKSQADMESQVIIAEAYAEAEQIKGEGDAEAAAIYNEAYNRDPEFYEFFMSMQTYKAALGNNTKIVISPDSPFAKYIYSATGAVN